MYELFRLIPETISGSKVKSEKSSRSLQENSRNAMIKNFKNFVFIPKRIPNLHILEIKLTIIKKKVYLQVLMKRVLFFLILSISLSAYSQKSIPNISLSDFEGEKTKIFEAIDENTCKINFEIDFELNIKFFDLLMKKFFDLAFKKMVDAFLERANEIY